MDSYVVDPMRMPPGRADVCNRAATFVASPIAVKLRCGPAPTLPSAAGPVLTPIRNRGHPGCSRRVLGGALHVDRRSDRPDGVIRLVVEGVEQDEDRVAREPLDQPLRSSGQDRNGCRPVRVQHLHDLDRRAVAGEIGEPREVGEQHRNLRLAAAELGELGLAFEPRGQLRTDVGSEQVVDARELVRRAFEQHELVEVKPSRRSRSSTGPSGSPDCIAPASWLSASDDLRSRRSRVCSRYRPPKAPATDPMLRYSFRIANSTIANAIAISTCHSHQDACQLLANATATSASASSTNETATDSGSVRRRAR